MSAEHDLDTLNRDSAAWLRWWGETGERELRCILMTAWDPVGVGDAPEAWGEYDDYVRGVAHRLRDTADPDQAGKLVAEYLNHIERDSMEIAPEGSPLANRHLAASLEWSFRRGGHPPSWSG